MTEHKVVITIDERDNPVPQPTRTVTANKDDTIRWDSPRGPVRIKFAKASPFDKDEVKGSEAHRVRVEEGVFRYFCSVTVDGKEVGWPGNKSPDAGGEVRIVRR
jgi:hypothetical protein